jgi:hypothetical protein
VSDDRGESTRVHEEEFKVGQVLDEEFFVAGRDQVSGLLVGSVTGEKGLALWPMDTYTGIWCVGNKRQGKAGRCLQSRSIGLGKPIVIGM